MVIGKIADRESRNADAPRASATRDVHAPDPLRGVSCNRANRNRVQRRGIVLVLVMAFAALVALLGFAAMETSSIEYPEALNLQGAARARYLASSGVALAAHYLRVPPSTVPVGNYWTGTTGFSIDGTGDTCDVTVTRSGTASDNYIVTSIGTDRDPDGAVRARSTVTTEIVTPPPKIWTMTRAFYNATAGFVATSRITFNGDIFGNGNITGSANCSGNILATGSITTGWSGGPSYSPNGTAPLMPALNASQWNRYVIHGVVKQPQTFAGSSITASNVNSLAGGGNRTVCWPSASQESAVVVDLLGTLLGGSSGLGDTVQVVTATLCLGGTSKTGASCITNDNPGGVIVVDGNLTINAATYIGTFVVNGNISVTGGTSISAMPYYPALVATGDISFSGGPDIRGPILCGGKLSGTSPNLTATGFTITYGTGFASTFASSANANFTFRSGFGSIYDFSLTSFDPMTLLRWQE